MSTPNTIEGFRILDSAYQDAKHDVIALEASPNTSSEGCCNHTTRLFHARAALRMAGVTRNTFMHQYPEITNAVFKEDHDRLVSPTFSD